jgi:hypothetical protein
LARKPEGKRLLGRLRLRWADNIKIEEIGWGDGYWIGLDQDKGQVKSSCDFGDELLGSTKMLGNYRVTFRVVLSYLELVS